MSIRSLSIGMTGEDVRAIQNALNAHRELPGAPLEPDGRFGPLTDAKVRAFQASERIAVDGVVGPQTRLALFPLGVATVTVIGARLVLPGFGAARRDRFPNVMSGRLTPPFGGAGPAALNVDWSKIVADFRSDFLANYPGPPYFPVRIPRAVAPLPAPDPPELTPPPILLPSVSGPPSLLGFDYDHLELVPGGQSTFPLGGWRQDAFTLTMQMIYQRGPDDGHNQTITTGVQIGAPVTAPFPNGGPWTFNPFVQFTDVDRFWRFGALHLVQPYAQVGAQFQGPGDAHPTLTSGLFPINIGLDVGEVLTLQAAGGMVLNLDLSTGQVVAGPQLTFGLALKFGKTK